MFTHHIRAGRRGGRGSRGRHRQYWIILSTTANPQAPKPAVDIKWTSSLAWDAATSNGGRRGRLLEPDHTQLINQFTIYDRDEILRCDNHFIIAKPKLFLPRIAEFNLAHTVSLCWGSSCQPTGEFHGLEYANRLKASCSIFLLLSFFPYCCLRCIDCEYNCLPNSSIFSIACLLPPHNCFLLLLLVVLSVMLLVCWLWLALLSISANGSVRLESHSVSQTLSKILKYYLSTCYVKNYLFFYNYIHIRNAKLFAIQSRSHPYLRLPHFDTCTHLRPDYHSDIQYCF